VRVRASLSARCWTGTGPARRKRLHRQIASQGQARLALHLAGRALWSPVAVALKLFNTDHRRSMALLTLLLWIPTRHIGLGRRDQAELEPQARGQT